MIKKLCLIGVGLIGGSLARALRQAGYVDEIVGCGRRQATLEKAKSLHVIDTIEMDMATAVNGADFVVIAVPLAAIGDVLHKIKGNLSNHTVITDVGSAKASVINTAKSSLGPMISQFVPGHPIAGKEKSGVEASVAELFQQRRVVLTPLSQTKQSAIDQVRACWQIAGAEVVIMDAEEHDEILAATSHLPHLLAYTFVDQLAQIHQHRNVFEYAAGGFRDFSRIASSDPTMWRDICLTNRSAILRILDQFSEKLEHLKMAVENSDQDALYTMFERAKITRDKFVD